MCLHALSMKGKHLLVDRYLLGMSKCTSHLEAGVAQGNFLSPDRYEKHIQLSTDFQFCAKLGTPVSTSTTRKLVIYGL